MLRMKKFEGLVIYYFVLQSVSNGIYVPSSDDLNTGSRPIIDTGGLSPVRSLDPSTTAGDVESKPVGSLEKVVQSVLEPGPAIVPKIDEYPPPVKDAGAAMSATGDVLAGQSKALSDSTEELEDAKKMAEVQRNDVIDSKKVEADASRMAVPNNVIADQNGVVAPPSNEVAEPSNVKAPPNNMMAPPNNMTAPQSNVGAPPNNMMAPQSNVGAPPNNMMAPPNNMTAPQSNVGAPPNDVVANLSNVEPPTSNVAADTGLVKDDGHVSLQEAGNWKITGNESWWGVKGVSQGEAKSEEQHIEKAQLGDEKIVNDDKDNSDEKGYEQHPNGQYDDDQDDDNDWWKDDDDDDDDDWLDDDYDDDDWLYDDDDDDDDWLYDDDDDDDVVTTKKIPTTTTIGDYDFDSDEKDDDDEESSEENVDAGKDLMQSVSNFDTSYGAFGGAKVTSKGSLSHGAVYSWTLLLMICIVLIGFFIFWNRHKVEKYIISLRHPAPSVKNGAPKRDEEENLLENEYA